VYQYPWALPGGFLKKGEHIYKTIQPDNILYQHLDYIKKFKNAN